MKNGEEYKEEEPFHWILMGFGCSEVPQTDFQIVLEPTYIHYAINDTVNSPS